MVWNTFLADSMPNDEQSNLKNPEIIMLNTFTIVLPGLVAITSARTASAGGAARWKNDRKKAWLGMALIKVT